MNFSLCYVLFLPCSFPYNFYVLSGKNQEVMIHKQIFLTPSSVWFYEARTVFMFMLFKATFMLCVSVPSVCTFQQRSEVAIGFPRVESWMVVGHHVHAGK